MCQGRPLPRRCEWPTAACILRAGFVDAYREMHPDPIKHLATHGRRRPPTDDPKDHHDRIDFVLVSGRGWDYEGRDCRRGLNDIVAAGNRRTTGRRDQVRSNIAGILMASTNQSFITLVLRRAAGVEGFASGRRRMPGVLLLAPPQPPHPEDNNVKNSSRRPTAIARPPSTRWRRRGSSSTSRLAPEESISLLLRPICRQTGPSFACANLRYRQTYKSGPIRRIRRPLQTRRRVSNSRFRQTRHIVCATDRHRRMPTSRPALLPEAQRGEWKTGLWPLQ